ncbi:MAG: hypothetical protein AMXMBFR33_01540 [Candidatus Xenobia bacterium]
MKLQTTRKSFPFVGVKADVAQRTITGYAATWDPDQVGDTIRKGAFAETIAQRGPNQVDGQLRSKIKLFYNHTFIIGIPTVMREDERGLYIEARIDETSLGNDVLAMCSSGTLDAMSFSYDVEESQRSPDTGRRELIKLKVYEFGPVDFPANELAAITGVKAGRVLSAASITKLDRAIGALTELRSVACSDDEEEDEDVDLDDEKGLTNLLRDMKSFRKSLSSKDDESPIDTDEDVDEADEGSDSSSDDEEVDGEKSGARGRERKGSPRAMDISARLRGASDAIWQARWSSDADEKRKDLEEVAVILEECVVQIRNMASESDAE